jgi:hypothetical protein
MPQNRYEGSPKNYKQTTQCLDDQIMSTDIYLKCMDGE